MFKKYSVLDRNWKQQNSFLNVNVLLRNQLFEFRFLTRSTSHFLERIRSKISEKTNAWVQKNRFDFRLMKNLKLFLFDDLLCICLCIVMCINMSVFVISMPVYLSQSKDSFCTWTVRKVLTSNNLPIGLNIGLITFFRFNW